MPIIDNGIIVINRFVINNQLTALAFGGFLFFAIYNLYHFRSETILFLRLDENFVINFGKHFRYHMPYHPYITVETLERDAEVEIKTGINRVFFHDRGYYR